MWPLRPTAMATPGATASSIAVFTSLSSFPARPGSSPELLRPTSGSMYLIGVGGAATTRAGGGGAQAAAVMRIRANRKDFMGATTPEDARGTRRLCDPGPSDLHVRRLCGRGTTSQGYTAPPGVYRPGARMQFRMRSPAATESSRVLSIGQGGGTALVSERCPLADTDRTAAQPSSSWSGRRKVVPFATA